MRWNRKIVLAALFFISGFSALIYEILWIRDFSFLLGNSTYTISVVLAAYMAGLALGSWLAGPWTSKTVHPVLVYALIEALIGLCGLGVRWFLHSGLSDLGPIAPGELGGVGPLLIRFAVSFVLLLPSTALMGATLPFLTRLLPESEKQDGFFLGLLYGSNTLGAALGCFFAGFFFLRLWGMAWTTHLAALLNGSLALCAWALAGWFGPLVGKKPSRPAVSGSVNLSKGHDRTSSRFLLWAFAFSGFTCMAYEIIYFRWLSYLLGNRVFASSAMIATFLFGIALGSLAVGWIVDKWGGEIRVFSFLQILIGLSALALALYYPDARDAFQAFEKGHGLRNAWQYVAVRFTEAFLLLVVPATSFGAIFPTVLKYLHGGAGSLPKVVARAYAINTLGCILGSLLTGFVLLPLLGSYRALIFVAVLSLLLGHRILVPDWDLSGWGRRTASVGFSLVLVVFSTWIALSYCRYPFPMAGLKLIYSREDAAALVTVHTGPLGYYLYADATQLSFPIGPGTRAVQVQKLQAYLPLLLHPDPKRVLVVGCGFGVSAGSFAMDPRVESVECVELFPALLETMPFFSKENHDVVHQPKVRLIAADGRYYLRHAAARYDIIASNLTGSDLPGSASCYTREYFESAYRQLNPDGLLLVHVFGRDRTAILKTLRSVFPYVTGFKAYTFTQYLIASRQPLRFNPAKIKARLASNRGFREDCRRAGIWGAADLDKLIVFNNVEGKRMTEKETTPLNTDDLPVIEYRFREINQDVFLSKI